MGSGELFFADIKEGQGVMQIRAFSLCLARAYLVPISVFPGTQQTSPQQHLYMLFLPHESFSQALCLADSSSLPVSA